MASDAQKKATNKWNAENRKNFTVKLEKSVGEQFKELADSKGISCSAILKDLIYKYMQENGISVE